MKKWMATLWVLLTLFPGAMAQQAGGAVPADRLVGLAHNAPNTGIMLPEGFSPWEETYLLTVADWVSRITFTPTAASPNAAITVNGQPVQSGQKSQVIRMTNEPQAVRIAVTAPGGTSQTTYTIYLQRRPSERRTRVSAGYISEITLHEGKAVISADLVTLRYQENTNLSTFYNDTVYMYRYACAANCLYYYGPANSPVRVQGAQEFIDHYLSGGSNLYYLIYIDDEIVAVMPYQAD